MEPRTERPNDRATGTRDWRPAFEQQTARINVTDNEWRAFRARCLADGEHVSEVLGRLVRAELDGDVAGSVVVEPEPAPVTRERVNTPPKTEKPAAVVTAIEVEHDSGPVFLSLFEIDS